MSPFMKKAGTISFYLLLPILLFVFFGCSTSSSKKTILQKNTAEISALQKTIVEQQELLQNLQALTADQIQRNSELEQAIPPRDLLESLQNGFVELRKKITVLEKQVSSLQKSTTESAKKKKDPEPPEVEFPRDQKQLLQGLISLQAGNPDQAVEHLEKILKQKKATLLKGEILLAVAHSFLAQGHARQAASHYGTFLREYPKSRHIAQALYFLGDAMGKLGQQKKQKVLWKELTTKYPKSPFAKRAK
ncbi:MAG: tetratricopeptide repeat protein [Deltaproteobacteria bacterium]|nr:tetratricopeptide repeat protein [Deltaproteobacteria bacterium]